jgi:ABC-type multidrug transport system fused ATPase/permease subunit
MDKLMNKQINNGAAEKKRKAELSRTREEVSSKKREKLAEVKSSVLELFGNEKIPKELLLETIELRKAIRSKVEELEYLDDINDFEDEINLLALKIVRYKELAVKGFDPEEIVEMKKNERGEIGFLFKDGHHEILNSQEAVLAVELINYFESYRMAENGGRFRKNVVDTTETIVEDNKARKQNFYSAGEKQEALADRLAEKYEKAGFSRPEIKELIGFCDLKKLDELDIHEIGVLAKVGQVFRRFMGGDKSKYVALSAALLVPAFLEGYAPGVLADSFKSGLSKIDLTQVGLYAALSAASAGSSIAIERLFKDFLVENYSKDTGVSQEVSKNLAEFPAHEIQQFGADVVRRRVEQAKGSYENVYRLISYDIMPAVVTIATSVAVLADKSKALAVGTAAGAGLRLALDMYVNKKGKFWEKKGAAQTQGEAAIKRLAEQLNAHMEIILAGEKDRLAERLKLYSDKENSANAQFGFLKRIQQNINQFSGALNTVIAGAVSAVAGGGADKFVAALIYSGRFNESISQLLYAKNELNSSLRDMEEMELMFNGYAAEEEEREKTRIGASEVKGSDIEFKGVGVAMGKKEILKNVNLRIPAGAMVNLSGASGAGKSTLIKLMSGYYQPTSGEISYGDRKMDEIKKSGEDSIYNKVAYLSQFPYIFEGSIDDNLTFGTKHEVPPGEVKKILGEVGLDKRFGKSSEKLTGGRGDMGSTSGGETSRIGLARTILKIRYGDSKLVFLDEPTASVDNETKKVIADLINKEKQSRPDVTFVVISHDQEFIRQLDCTMELNMKDGKLEK